MDEMNKMTELNEQEMNQVAGGDYWDNTFKPIATGGESIDRLPEKICNLSKPEG